MSKDLLSATRVLSARGVRRSPGKQPPDDALQNERFGAANLEPSLAQAHGLSQSHPTSSLVDTLRGSLEMIRMAFALILHPVIIRQVKLGMQ